MPNGKPYDHPFTDILIHGRRVYSETADTLVREIAAIASREEQDRLAEMLFQEYNELEKPDVRKLEKVLREMRDRIKPSR